MKGKYVEVDTSEFEEFFKSLGNAAKGEFRKELELFLEGVGYDFLRVVRDEIKRRKLMDSRLLLASFVKDADGSVWEIKDGGLSLNVGTSVEYAKYVNDGHWKNPKGIEKRFVPGRWKGKGENARFIYDPKAKTGMVLKQDWVDAHPYFDSALRIFDRIYQEMLENKMQEWIDSYFGG